MTIYQAYGPYMTYARAENSYAAETLAKLRDCFSRWLLPMLGHIELLELKPLDILKLREAMANAPVGASRQYSVLMTLKQFLKFCILVIQINTLDPNTIKLPKRGRPEVHYLTNEEVLLVRENIDVYTHCGLRLRALFEFLISSGLRISEVLSLNISSPDFENMETEVIGKGNKKRTVFFSQDAVRYLLLYLKIRKDTNAALFVTTGPAPRRLKRNDISGYFGAIGEQSGLKKRLTPHLLRHTFCTNLLHNGADISFIKELAGHQDIHTTARYYLGVDKKALRDVIKRCQHFEVRAPAA